MANSARHFSYYPDVDKHAGLHACYDDVSTNEKSRMLCSLDNAIMRTLESDSKSICRDSMSMPSCAGIMAAILYELLASISGTELNQCCKHEELTNLS